MGEKGLKVRLRTFRYSLDASVVQIPDPAGQPQRGRPATGMVAEKNALDQAGEDEPFSFPSLFLYYHRFDKSCCLCY